MPTITNIRKGLEIIEAHLEPGDCRFLGAEHDIIYAASKPRPGSEDGKKLVELGWYWDSDVDSWSAFT